MFSFGKSEQIFGFVPENNEETITIIRKGNTKKEINLDNLENIIISLSRHPNYKINELEGKLKDDHQKLVNYVELFYGSDHYHILIDLIHKHFSKYKKPIPGTIAGYAYGCNVKINGIAPECSSLCANGIKLTNNDNYCDFPVVYATYEDDQFTFQTVDGIGSNHKVIIHLEYTSLQAFPGFNEREKDHLRRYGYQRAYLYGKKSGGLYINLYADRKECDSDNSISIDDIKSRAGTVEGVYHHKNGLNSFNLSNTLLLLLIVIIILLIAFFFYKYYTKRSE